MGSRIDEYYDQVINLNGDVGETMFIDTHAPDGEKVMRSIENVRENIRSRDNKNLAIYLKEDFNRTYVNNKCFHMLRQNCQNLRNEMNLCHDTRTKCYTAMTHSVSTGQTTVQ